MLDTHEEPDGHISGHESTLGHIENQVEGEPMISVVVSVWAPSRENRCPLLPHT